jgi:Tfp pilus assembly protein PilE
MNAMKSHGFTVVELIVIIVVIGVLAGIVALVWPNYLKQTHDAERRSDLQQLASALDVYALQKNDSLGAGSNCGKDGLGNGWVSAVGTVDGSNYPNSILSCLQAIEALPNEPFNDPSGCVSIGSGECAAPVRAYMKATCTTSGVSQTYLFAHLETEPANAGTIDALCDAGSVEGFTSTVNAQRWGTLYGMNYYVKVN